MICLSYFATSVTANINVHALTAQLVWPLCVDILVTSKNLPHSDWFSKDHRNMVNVVVIPQKCSSFASILLFFFFCTSRSSISLVPGSLPGLCLCYTTVPFRLRQGLKVSKLLGNQRSERSRIFLFSLSLLGGCWKITNALWKWGAAFWALLGIHVCEWTIYRYGKALLISELFRKEVPLGSPHFSSLFLKHHWVTLNLLPSWKTSLQSSLKKEKYPWTVKKTIPKGADHDLVTG